MHKKKRSTSILNEKSSFSCAQGSSSAGTASAVLSHESSSYALTHQKKRIVSLYALKPRGNKQLRKTDENTMLNRDERPAPTAPGSNKTKPSLTGCAERTTLLMEKSMCLLHESVVSGSSGQKGLVHISTTSRETRKGATAHSLERSCDDSAGSSLVSRTSLQQISGNLKKIVRDKAFTQMHAKRADVEKERRILSGTVDL